MKRYLFILLQSCLTIACMGQDVIVLNGGKTILSKVLEVTQTEIKYKKFSNIEGPLYTIDKSEVLSINYENGDIDKFDGADNLEKDSKKVLKSTVQSDNSILINQYNQDNHYQSGIKKFSKKRLKKYETDIHFIHLSESSILHNSELRIDLALSKDGFRTYDIIIQNETNENIYIDLGSSFCIYPNGNYLSYYENRTTTNYDLTTNTKEKGIGLNMGLGAITSALGIGGIVGNLANATSIGLSSANSTSNTTGTVTTDTEKRIISIPPKANYIVRGHWWITERFGWKLGMDINFPYFNDYYYKKGTELFEDGQETLFTEDNTPDYKTHMFTYSLNPDFSDFNVITFKTYIAKSIRAKGPMLEILRGDGLLTDFDDKTLFLLILKGFD